MGKILAICTSPKRGTVKTEVPSAVLTPEWGIVSDAHGGNWHRQVSLLSAEKIEAFRKKIWVDYGAFGENLVIEGFDFRNLPVTSRFAIGDVVLEMTQIGKECHNDCVIKQKTGECIMPREGVFARVLTGGEIHVGDEVTLLPPLENPPPRAPPRRNGLPLPVAYNTGGYETVETVKALAGYVDIWLADYKYASPALAKELSAAQDYPQVAHAAIRQMLLQTGAPVYDADGYLQKGVIVRHLALPGHCDDSLAVLQRLADLRQETGVSFVPSLMSQFTPFYRAAEHGLGRRITTYEYRKVVDRAIALGLTDGYMQEKSSAREEYTPPFDLEGV